MLTMRALVGFFILLLAAGCASDKGAPDNGCASLVEYKYFGENARDYAGYWVSSAGDVDGDRLGDVLVGAYDNDEGGQVSGAAYLILGKSFAKRGQFNIASANYKFVGEKAGDFAGIMVTGVGDLDGDGKDDILIGAPQRVSLLDKDPRAADEKGPATGLAYVVLAKSLGKNSSIDLSKADYRLIGEKADDFAAYAVSSAGDVDGDGLPDLLIGASGQDAGGRNAGAAYIVLGKSLANKKTIHLAKADFKFVGEAADDYAGYYVSGAGDVDGDGLADIVIGAANDEGAKEAHAVYVIRGRSLGKWPSVVSLSKADYKIVGESPYDYASQVSLPGDVDGDGLSDILIGAAGHDSGTTNEGAAYIVLGKSLGSKRMINLSNADHKLVGENHQDGVGATAAHAGDVDGDGLGDVLVGALRYTGSYAKQGAAYLVLGKDLAGRTSMDLSEAYFRFAGDKGKRHVGHAVSSAGDIDGDGLGDIVVGAWDAAPWRGAAYIITGKSAMNNTCTW